MDARTDFLRQLLLSGYLPFTSPPPNSAPSRNAKIKAGCLSHQTLLGELSLPQQVSLFRIVLKGQFVRGRKPKAES